MSNERPVEFLSWRGHLASPDALPEQGLDDKEVSWERLAERLREKPRPGRIGYWIAAACLLLALIPATHFFRDRPARVALHPSPRRQIVTDRTASRRGPAATHVAAPAFGPVQTSVRPVASRRLPISRPVAHAVAALPIGPVSVTDSVSAADRLSAVNRLPAVDAVSTVDAVSGTSPAAQTPPPPKQWRIVYLNEINKSAGPAPGTITRDPGFIHVGTGSIGAGDWVAGQNNYPILKIELSSPSH